MLSEPAVWILAGRDAGCRSRALNVRLERPYATCVRYSSCRRERGVLPGAYRRRTARWVWTARLCLYPISLSGPHTSAWTAPVAHYGGPNRAKRSRWRLTVQAERIGPNRARRRGSAARGRPTPRMTPTAVVPTTPESCLRPTTYTAYRRTTSCLRLIRAHGLRRRGRARGRGARRAQAGRSHARCAPGNARRRTPAARPGPRPCAPARSRCRRRRRAR